MLLKHGFFAVVGHGVEVEIDDVALIEAELHGLLDEGGLKLVDVNIVQGIGVGGHGGALGQDIEPGEQTEPRIEGVVRDMGVALGTQEFERQEGEKVVQRGNGLALGQAG